MASVKKLASGRWQARWREVPGGPQKARNFDRKIDADRFLTKTSHDLLVGVYVDPKLQRVTLEGFVRTWLARQHWRPSTAAIVRSSLDKHILPTFGARPLGAITRADVEAWARGLKLAPSTVATVRQHLGQIFTAAVLDGLLPRSPASNAKMPKTIGRPVRALTMVQVEALTAAASPAFRITVMLGFGAGLRQGEATGLTVDRVDFMRRELRVDRQLVTLRRASAEFGPPKTSASFRVVPLADVVVAALAEHVRLHGTGRDGLVLHRDGGPMDRNRFGDAWRATATRAGLPGVRMHDLRHTFASTLLSAGVSIAAVGEWLGHDSPTTTLRTYAHFMPADAERGRTVIERALTQAAEDSLRTELAGT